VTTEAQNQANLIMANVLATLDAKPSVRVAVTTNVSLATPGATQDGVTINIGESILLTAQTNATPKTGHGVF